MNIYGLDIGQLDPKEAIKILSDPFPDRFPGIPPFLSKKDCAAILGVSMKIINQLTESGKLPLIDVPGDSQPYFDLFGEIIEPQRKICILRADLVDYVEKALLCNKPVLDTENDL